MPGPRLGRFTRIKYDADGTGSNPAVAIARAISDEIEINNEYVDSTSKDDSGWQSFLNDVGVKSMKLKCSGQLTDAHKTLVGLFANAATGTSLHTFEITLDELGTFRGLWALSSLKAAGEDKDNVQTFEFELMSSGAITWTALP